MHGSPFEPTLTHLWPGRDATRKNAGPTTHVCARSPRARSLLCASAKVRKCPLAHSPPPRASTDRSCAHTRLRMCPRAARNAIDQHAISPRPVCSRERCSTWGAGCHAYNVGMLMYHNTYTINKNGVAPLWSTTTCTRTADGALPMRLGALRHRGRLTLRLSPMGRWRRWLCRQSQPAVAIDAR